MRRSTLQSHPSSICLQAQFFVIRFDDLVLQRGTKVLFDHATATLNPGERVGLVGVNGSGKSTLFSMLRGELHADGGEVAIPPTWQVAHVAQERRQSTAARSTTPSTAIPACATSNAGSPQQKRRTTAMRRPKPTRPLPMPTATPHRRVRRRCCSVSVSRWRRPRNPWRASPAAGACV